MEKNESICPSCGAKITEGNTCAYCGTKITVLETESASQIAKNKESSELANLRTLARRAQEANEDEDAQKYYDMILIKKPNDWEAYFYTKYYKVGSGRIGDIPKNVSNLIKSFKPTFSIIKDSISDDKEIEEILLRIYTHVRILTDSLLNNIITLSTSGQSDYLPYPIVLLDSLGDEIQSSFDKKHFALAVMCWKKAIESFDAVISAIENVYGDNLADYYYDLLVMRLSDFDGRSEDNIIEKIREYDDSFMVQEEQDYEQSDNKKRIGKIGMVISIIALILSAALLFLFMDTCSSFWLDTICIMIAISFFSVCGFGAYNNIISD